MANSIISKAKVSLASILAAAMFSVSGCSQQPVEGKVCTEKACPTCVDSYSELSTVDGSDSESDILPSEDISLEVKEGDSLEDVLKPKCEFTKTEELKSCKFGGWVPGTTYVINSPITAQISSDFCTSDIGGFKNCEFGCFNLKNVDCVELVGQDNNVIRGKKSNYDPSLSSLGGIYIDGSKNIYVRNMLLQDFNNFLAVTVVSSSNITLDKLTFVDNVSSLMLGINEDLKSIGNNNIYVTNSTFGVTANNMFSTDHFLRVYSPMNNLVLTDLSFNLSNYKGNNNIKSCLSIVGDLFNSLENVTINNVTFDGCNVGTRIMGINSTITFTGITYINNKGINLALYLMYNSDINLQNVTSCSDLSLNPNSIDLFVSPIADSTFGKDYTLVGKGNFFGNVVGPVPDTLKYQSCPAEKP